MIWCEVLNAVTMLPPPFILLMYACNPSGILAFAAIAAQAPFAILYHIHTAICLWKSEDTPHYHRQLDQTAQHVAQVALTFAITASWQYTLAAALFHTVALKQLWSDCTKNDGRRWTMIATGVAIYTLPMLFTSTLVFAYATVPMIMGAIVGFEPHCRFGGSHAIMHILAWMHTDAIGVFLK